MTDAVLLCSYQFNQYNGYQEAYVDMKDRRLWAPSQKPELFPKPVVDFFSMAGSEAVCGYDAESKKYFFLVKYMDVMHRDEAGRKVYINIAFLSDRMDEMQNLTDGFCAQYKAVEKAFAGLLVLDVSGVLSYSIDFDLLSSVMESCIALGKTGVKNIFPIRFSNQKPLSYVVVKPSWEYFAIVNGKDVVSSVPYAAIQTPDLHFSDMIKGSLETLFPQDANSSENISLSLTEDVRLFYASPAYSCSGSKSTGSAYASRTDRFEAKDYSKILIVAGIAVGVGVMIRTVGKVYRTIKK